MENTNERSNTITGILAVAGMAFFMPLLFAAFFFFCGLCGAAWNFCQRMWG